MGTDIWIKNTEAVKEFHRRVCVTQWKRNPKTSNCCNGVGYEKNGHFCISFAVYENSRTHKYDSFSTDGDCSDSGQFGDSSISMDENTLPDNSRSHFPEGIAGPNPKGDGIVYPDNDRPAIKIVKYKATENNPCTDLEIYFYMVGLLKQKADYSLIFQNCRDFSEAVFNHFNKD